VLEIYINFDINEYRFMIFNLGCEIWKN
jgi:hypothetical protein